MTILEEKYNKAIEKFNIEKPLPFKDAETTIDQRSTICTMVIGQTGNKIYHLEWWNSGRQKTVFCVKMTELFNLD